MQHRFYFAASVFFACCWFWVHTLKRPNPVYSTPAPVQQQVARPAPGTPRLVRPPLPPNEAGNIPFLENRLSLTIPTRWRPLPTNLPAIIEDHDEGFTIRASREGASAFFVSETAFGNAFTITYTLQHDGFGRTTVGLYGMNRKDWLASTVLDTDDTNYMCFATASQSTQYKWPSQPFMNTKVKLGFKVLGESVQFIVNGTVYETFPFPIYEYYSPAISVSSVKWKSGDNVTTFFEVEGRP